MLKNSWGSTWEKASSTSTLIFCVTVSSVQEQILFIHLMDIAYIRQAGRQDRMCIRGSRWFNTWWRYSVVKFYCSRQRNILFVDHLMELSHFSLFYLVCRPFDGTISFFSFLWSLVLFRFPSSHSMLVDFISYFNVTLHFYLVGPSFLFCDPWDSHILQQSQ